MEECFSAGPAGRIEVMGKKWERSSGKRCGGEGGAGGGGGGEEEAKQEQQKGCVWRLCR